MHFHKHFQSHLTKIFRKLKNLIDVSYYLNILCQKNDRTGYSTPLKPLALLAITSVPTCNLLASESSIENLDSVSMPTSAAKNTTSKSCQFVSPSFGGRLTSSHANVMLFWYPNLLVRSWETSSEASSRSTLWIIAVGNTESRQSDVKGSGPEPMKAIFRVEVLLGR